MIVVISKITGVKYEYEIPDVLWERIIRLPLTHLICSHSVIGSNVNSNSNIVIAHLLKANRMRYNIE
jgi:hypothetical protein